jgi:hypothetical protein
MPPGLYPRTTAMQTYGKTAGIRGDILKYRETHSLTQTAKEFDISVATVCKLQKGEWNATRTIRKD